jgi:hypothetical protein
MKNILLNKETYIIIFLTLFSILINQYYGNKGVFPADSFAHFDTGFRILLDVHPFKDFWIVSGPLIDYIQAIFFYFFGVNWQSYVFHASFFNAILSVSTYFVLRNFNLNFFYCLIYSLLFAALAYPSSGTPFVDHHSAFFSLLGIYSLILAIKSEKKIFWILLPIILGFAFLSKQVPSSYIIISVVIVLFIFSLIKKKFYWIKYSFLGSVLFICSLIIFGKFQEISLSSFITQYLLYPQTIGLQRFQSFEFTFRGLIGHFKFIYIAASILFYVNCKRIILEKNYIRNNDFYYFLILILLSFSLIFHQVFTRNQTFIFFLIPILFSFSHINLNLLKNNFNKFVSILLIMICLFITFKYHLRFNESRKFHELNYVNFNSFTNAKEIDNKFTGLKWITPEYNEESAKEIKIIKEAKDHLSNDNRIKMLITNYSFFSAILQEKFYSPSRWYILDGTDYPLKNNKYFINYKNLLTKIIKNNNIEVIYIIYPQESSVIYNVFDRNCFIEREVTKTLISLELKKCYEINN